MLPVLSQAFDVAVSTSMVAQYSKVEAQDADDESGSPCRRSRLKSLVLYPLFYHFLVAATYITVGFASCVLLFRNTRPSTGMSSPVPWAARDVKIEQMWMPNDTFNPPGGRTVESDRAWNERHKRYVVIEHPERYGLEISASAPNSTILDAQMYSVSSFHQFHCLRLIRYSWYEALKRGANVLEDASGIPNSPPIKMLGTHIDHCFDFLRQALECHADPALEPFVEANGVPLLHGSSGWRTKHMCRDYNALLDWVNERNIPSFEADFSN